MLGYASVEVPLATMLIRRGAGAGKVFASALLAVPLTVAAGIGNMAVSPVLQSLGIGRGFLELSADLGVSFGIAYAAARMIAAAGRPPAILRRGTLIDDPYGEQGIVQTPQRIKTRAASAVREESAAATASISFAGVRVKALDETKHFKIIGTTGTGKSTVIRELLTAALDRGDRAIIADPDGGYLMRFRDESRGDLVLNPFERGSRRWSLFDEIKDPYDIDQLARSLLPDQGGSDRNWINYARTFFAAATHQAHEAGVTDIAELYRLLVVADKKELRGFLAGTPAQPFLEEHNGPMFDSIRSITSSAVGSLDYIARQAGEPLSIRQWVRQERGSGVLFMPYKAGQIAALRSTISAWMRLGIFEALSQPEGDQRLWFVIDELDALGQIDGLKDALARLRKFGGRCVLGLQSISQVSGTYGTRDAQTVIENCGNTLILRCSGSDTGGTAHFASRLIGQREVLRTHQSRSRRAHEWLDSSITLSEHVGIEPAVMDSQIEQLPDLSGYLKLASDPLWRRVDLVSDAPGSHGRGARGSSGTSSGHEHRESRIRGHAPSSENASHDHG